MQKTFDKIKHSFMIKTEQIRYLNIIMSIHNKPTANNTWKEKKLKDFSLRFGIRKRFCLFTPSIQQSPTNPSQSNYSRKRNQRFPNWKEEVKISLFSDDMKPQRPYKETITAINELIKVA
jgi:hypothetical protein